MKKDRQLKGSKFLNKSRSIITRRPSKQILNLQEKNKLLKKISSLNKFIQASPSKKSFDKSNTSKKEIKDFSKSMAPFSKWKNSNSFLSKFFF